VFLDFGWEGGLTKKGINKGKHESITLVFNKEIR